VINSNKKLNYLLYCKKFFTYSNIYCMKYIKLLALLLFSTNLYPQEGFLSRAGEGLFIDAAYAPSWRKDLGGSVIIRDVDFSTLGVSYWSEPSFLMEDVGHLFSNGLLLRAEVSYDRGASLQGRFLGFYDWDFKRDFFDENREMGISIAPFILNSDGFNVQEDNFERFRNLNIAYQESFNSIELNFLDHLTTRYYNYFSVSFLSGLRALRYISKTDVFGTSDTTLGVLLTPDNQVLIDNKNIFYGLQLGLIGRYRMGESVYVDVPIKGGVYVDQVSSHLRIYYAKENDTRAELQNLNKRKVVFGTCAEASPKLEMHYSGFYAYLGASFVYVYGISPSFMQLADPVSGINSIGTVPTAPSNNIDQPVSNAYLYFNTVFIGLGLHF
jgi:hypothetical protein